MDFERYVDHALKNVVHEAEQMVHKVVDTVEDPLADIGHAFE